MGPLSNYCPHCGTNLNAEEDEECDDQGDTDELEDDDGPE